MGPGMNTQASTPARSARARRTRALLLAGLLLPCIAHAELRDYTVRWIPSPSARVVGYLLSAGEGPGNYSLEFDLELPGESDGQMQSPMELEGSVDLYLALRARGEDGRYSDFSNEIMVAKVPIPIPEPTPDPEPIPIPIPEPTPDPEPVPTPEPEPTPDPELPPASPIVGVVANSAGQISLADLGGRLSDFTQHELAAPGDLRPAWCDLDGDGEDDLVVGFGAGSDGQVLVLTLQEGLVVDHQLIDAGYDRIRVGRRKTKTYAEINGETYPACGDVDGDGADEIVVGLGWGGRRKIHVFDDASAAFAELWVGSKKRVDSLRFGGFKRRSASAVPALGDVDGDGRDEIVIGRVTRGVGELAVFDDATTKFEAIHASVTYRDHGLAPLIVPTPSGVEYDGNLWPTLGDVDADGFDEIVVGLGERSGGRMVVMDDQLSAFALMSVPGTPDGSIQAGWDAYNTDNGQVYPNLADIDGDGLPELAVGFGAGGEGVIQLLDDLDSGFAPYPETVGLDGIVDTQLGVWLLPAMRPGLGVLWDLHE